LPRIASEFERHCPVTWNALLQVQSALGGQGAEAIARATATAYEEVVPEPIDVAVMEKLADLRVIPAAVGWTDLGSWRAVYDIAERDVHGSAAMSVAGKPPVLIDAPGCLVWSEDAQVALVGVQDLAVVCSGGRVLVCPLDRTQDVRHVVVRLASRDDGTR
jgi:mannose-1-phosphate guanylyltransferase